MSFLINYSTLARHLVRPQQLTR